MPFVGRDNSHSWFILSLVSVAVFALQPKTGDAADLDYNRDIRPILSDKCFYCHGPDGGHREADLRLDLQESAHEWVIVAGDPADSEFIVRITDTDPEVRMPPAESGKTLSDDEIDLLRRWIEQGARYQEHWSFAPPVRPTLPEMKQAEWARNAIDHFVSARLVAEGLKPSPPADRATLIRRVTLGPDRPATDPCRSRYFYQRPVSARV